MKKTVLIITTLLFVFTLSGCFGNHLEGYNEYSRSVGDYDLYYEDLSGDVECPQTDGYLYTLYSVDGNTYKYKGVRTSSGCYVPLKANTGNGFSTVDDLLDKEKITQEQIRSVLWTFDFVIDQVPDYEVGTIDFIEYFEQVGDYELYVADYDGMTCSDLNTVTLFEYEGVEYDVLGASSGEGCVSNYYIYYVEEAEDDSTDDDTTDDDTTDDDTTDADEDGDIISVYDALQLGYLSAGEVALAVYESEIFEVYFDAAVLATEATIFFVDELQTYNVSNPYSLTLDERERVLEVLGANRYRSVTLELDDQTPYVTLIDQNELEHSFLVFHETDVQTEDIVAVLTLTDAIGIEYVYEIYPSGIRIVSSEVDVYAENMNQTYILDLLELLE